jgi:hypothetical protein
MKELVKERTPFFSQGSCHSISAGICALLYLVLTGRWEARGQMDGCGWRSKGEAEAPCCVVVISLASVLLSEFCSDLRNPVKCIARQDTTIAGSSSVYTRPCHALFLLGRSRFQSRTDVIQAIHSKLTHFKFFIISQCISNHRKLLKKETFQPRTHNSNTK